MKAKIKVQEWIQAGSRRVVGKGREGIGEGNLYGLGKRVSNNSFLAPPKGKAQGRVSCDRLITRCPNSHG